MSADKNRRERRRMVLLDMASRGQGLAFHCEGGRSMRDPDVQRLIRDGLIVFRRVDNAGRRMPTKGSLQFKREIHGQHLYERIVRTRGQITEKGRGVLAAYGPVPREWDNFFQQHCYVDLPYPDRQRGSRFR